MRESFGVDLGNVIIDHVGFGTTPEFVQSGDYNVIPQMPGVIEALWQLNQERFAGNIFVVYNASDVADQKILSWLKSHDFFSRTGIYPAQVMRTKNGRDKSSICDLYQATHFVDDRLEVLSYLVDKVKNLYLLKPQQKEVKQYQDFLPHVQLVTSWDEIVRTLLV
ncbi:MAG: hypothetical protein A3G47_02965 [Candidatus Zambryskibacteria bacterium RIFCSPLOWO2_12_FULL_39_45]|uniref:FCP1 homology domain-containing protein n=3 Tax=Candidatus Zambryskiibacteriota TaxID=1817925 RepID=A0A1G2TBG8_9BACT|nr:MAG: hypothetical protein UT81_C0003G0038 [Parcubacteria group bacterium GW2011_GWA2_40_14]OHA93951.1 MAG: hypothetical protein A2W58_01070 [Candidatus Zambryskibacteria bacterium RIFCSPHIGHO2_02_38_10.5]OHA95509.1 MAG: hypothetical protein A3C63_00490 [Candidatus Zambryskibacteria bacterium RIFCSPHIGHO2_02_FULL_39_82]OHA98929.1 MAG: hypothetical protein A3E32_01345 [Candidatus Zambryskibacteria bacterium RIFCSPHIGHO2_12_FULL_38_37]OHB07886.1 MAG: hypothetical protein A2W64_03500 [Candidatus